MAADTYPRFFYLLLLFFAIPILVLSCLLLHPSSLAPYACLGIATGANCIFELIGLRAMVDRNGLPDRRRLLIWLPVDWALNLITGILATEYANTSQLCHTHPRSPEDSKHCAELHALQGLTFTLFVIYFFDFLRVVEDVVASRSDDSASTNGIAPVFPRSLHPITDPERDGGSDGDSEATVRVEERSLPSNSITTFSHNRPRPSTDLGRRGESQEGVIGDMRAEGRPSAQGPAVIELSTRNARPAPPPQRPSVNVNETRRTRRGSDSGGIGQRSANNWVWFTFTLREMRLLPQ